MSNTPGKTAYDPYALTPDAVRGPPPTIGQALRQVGPGLILAAAIVGTGELIATTHAGATAGFAILWLVILSCVIKVFAQIELGRHAVSSGETTMASFARLPGPGRLFTWWWLLMMLATQTQISAMIGGVGYTVYQVVQLVVPGVDGGLDRPVVPWAVFTALATILLLVRGTYRLIETSMTTLVVVFTALTVCCVVLLPFNAEYAFGWSDLASGLTFHIPAAENPERRRQIITAVFAMIGITGVGASELIAYPYWCIEKGYARYVGPKDATDDWLRRAKGWLRVMKLDAWVSMAVYTFATLAFFILGAAVLHSGESTGLPNTVDGMVGRLTDMYAPVLGPNGARAFILVGAFAVLYSTLVSATAANARAATDFLRVNGFIALRGPEERFRLVRWWCVGLILMGLALFLFFPNPVLMVMVGGTAQALTLPMIAAAAIYMRYKRTDRRLTPHVGWDLGLWLSLCVFVVAAVYGVWSQVQDRL